MYRETFVGSKL